MTFVLRLLVEVSAFYGVNWTFDISTSVPLLTFQRTGASSWILWFMSSSTLNEFTTVLILKAIRYFLHQSRAFDRLRRWSFPFWWRPIWRFVSSLKLSHDTARMSRNSPKNSKWYFKPNKDDLSFTTEFKRAGLKWSTFKHFFTPETHQER